MEQETSTIRCKECGKTCVRLLAGYYENGKDKRWVDQNGRQFSGHKCPECHAEKQAKNKKKKNGYV